MTFTQPASARRRLASALLAIGALATACSDDGPTGPSASVPAPAPTIVSVGPSLGSTGGGTSIAITGTGLQSGLRVAFGAATAERSWFDTRTNDRLFTTTPNHPAGTVDVSVTNPDGQTARVVAAYTFAPPETFEANGDWTGGAGDYEFSLRIDNNAVVSVDCWSSGAVVLSPPAPVRDGEFSFADHLVTISGAIVAPNEAKGRVTAGPCVQQDWYVSRK
jgi:IPT/TIG domain